MFDTALTARVWGLIVRVGMVALVAAGFLCASAGEPGAAAADSLSWSSSFLIDHSLPLSFTGDVTGISCPSASLCVAGGNDHILVSTDPLDGANAVWTVADLVESDVVNVSCPSTSLCVADDGLRILTSTDPADGTASTWTVADRVSSAGDIACPSPTLCVASTSSGSLTSTDPAAGAGSVWTSATVTDSETNAVGLGSISCPSTGLCVAADASGNVISSNDPADGAGANWTTASLGLSAGGIQNLSCPSTSLCVGDWFGYVYESTDPGDEAGATWVSKLIDAHPLVGLSCASATLCVAGDSGGNVLTSADAGDGKTSTWATHLVEGGRTVWSLACSPLFCIGGDDRGNIVTSTDPADGATATWTIEAADGTNPLIAVSCPSSAFCAASDDYGNVAISTDPVGASAADWSAKNVDGVNTLRAISCPSSALCVAVDSAGNAVSSADPASGGAAVWGKKAINTAEPGAPLLGVSCPSATLCVAINNAGYVFTSVDPAAGAASTWATETNVGGAAISCPSVSLCVDVGGSQAWISTDPSDGATATWTPVQIGNTVVAEQLSCSSDSFCMASDSLGRGWITTDPLDGPSAVWNAGLSAVASISCTEPRFCAGVDDNGHVVVAPDAGAQTAWFGQSSVPIAPYNAISCASSTFCVVVDNNGAGVVGTAITEKLTVSVSGSGVVTGGGISCPGACSGTFAQGTAVQLTATPASGSKFAGWTGACSGTGACQVTLSSAQNVAATFTSTSAALTSTQVACRYDVASVSDRCTAVVSSATASPPAGQVNLAATGGGAFAAGSPTTTCTLARPTAGSASCSVPYTLPVSGAGTVTAGYVGDSSHRQSSGSTNPMSGVTTLGRDLTALRLSKRSFRAGHGHGTVVHFTIASPARVTFNVQKRSRRWTTVRGKLSLTGDQGSNHVHFLGRIGGATLHTGRYRLVATPSIGGVTGDAATVTFAIS